MAERRFPIQGRGAYRGQRSVPWWVGEMAWRSYARAGHGQQSVERIAERGGFDWAELGELLADQMEFERATTHPESGEGGEGR